MTEPEPHFFSSIPDIIAQESNQPRTIVRLHTPSQMIVTVDVNKSDPRRSFFSIDGEEYVLKNCIEFSRFGRDDMTPGTHIINHFSSDKENDIEYETRFDGDAVAYLEIHLGDKSLSIAYSTPEIPKYDMPAHLRQIALSMKGLDEWNGLMKDFRSDEEFFDAMKRFRFYSRRQMLEKLMKIGSEKLIIGGVEFDSAYDEDQNAFTVMLPYQGKTLQLVIPESKPSIKMWSESIFPDDEKELTNNRPEFLKDLTGPEIFGIEVTLK